MIILWMIVEIALIDRLRGTSERMAMRNPDARFRWGSGRYEFEYRGRSEAPAPDREPVMRSDDWDEPRP
jgi:hypothetical protein